MCWQQINFASEPCCAKCGVPFEYDLGDGAMCLNCQTKDSAYIRAVFLFKYNEISKKIIHKFKYYDHTYLAKYLAHLACNHIDQNFPECEIIIPVPLHRRRLISRFYNQSALLAKEIAQLRHRSFYSTLLAKTKHTAPQASLTRLQRRDNVKRSFCVNQIYCDLVVGKNILLIDDVMTTGATIEECSKALKEGGAKGVYVFTLAKVY